MRIPDVLVPEPGSIYLFDRAFIDFRRLNEPTGVDAIFVTRAPKEVALEAPLLPPGRPA